MQHGLVRFVLAQGDQHANIVRLGGRRISLFQFRQCLGKGPASDMPHGIPLAVMLGSEQ